MLNGKTFLAIIPARGGSKRLPRKNVLDLGGKPLIAWTIEGAKKSKYLDKIIVSTDDQEIAELSEKYGAEVQKRPSDLASDTASSVDVVIHTVESQETKYDFVMLLQPTSPLRNEKHIDEAIELLFEKKACAIISVCETDHSPLWCNILPDDGGMDNFIRDDLKNIRSQDLPKHYRLNGAIYICSVGRLLQEKTLLVKNKSFAYVMDIESSVDIDTKQDFQLVTYNFLQRKD